MKRNYSGSFLDFFDGLAPVALPEIYLLGNADELVEKRGHAAKAHAVSCAVSVCSPLCLRFFDVLPLALPTRLVTRGDEADPRSAVMARPSRSRSFSKSEIDFAISKFAISSTREYDLAWRPTILSRHSN